MDQRPEQVEDATAPPHSPAVVPPLVLIESEHAGYVWDPSVPERKEKLDFDKYHPSYIDMHLSNNTMVGPTTCPFTLDDLKNDKKPADFSDGLWKRLKGLRKDLGKHGKDIPKPKVGP
jgi:hypothetical protein